MANKPGNFLIRLVLIILVAAAIFFALDHFLSSGKKSSEATSGSTLTHDQAVQIGKEIGTQVGNEVGERIGRQVAAEMLAERASETATSTTSQSVQPSSTSPETVTVTTAEQPSAEPSSDAKQAAASQSSPTAPVDQPKVAPEAQPAAVAETPTPSGESSPVTAPASPARPKTAATWWDKSLSDDADALIMRYAGQLKSSDASAGGIALLFSGRFDSSTDFAGHIKVTDAKGQPVEGSWQNGANPGLIALKGVAKGRYSVAISAGLKDADGKTLKHDLTGPVRVD